MEAVKISQQGVGIKMVNQNFPNNGKAVTKMDEINQKTFGKFQNLY